MKIPILLLLSGSLFLATTIPLFSKTGTETTNPQCLLTANATAAGIITCNNPTTTITATAANGQAPYTFLWSTGASGATITVADCGAYTVTATDANNCTATKNVTVNCNNTPPAAVASSNGTITCLQLTAPLLGAGSATGAGITYIWSGPCIQGQPTGLNATACAGGTFTLQVTNAANGCTATASTDVDADITPPVVVIAPPGQLNCTTTTIQLDATGSSSGANFPFQWTVTNGGQIINGANTLTPTVNAPGTYTLTMTNLANGCTAAAARNVGQNIAAPTAEAGPDAALDCTTTQATLNGTGTSTGPIFTYLWTTTGGNIVSGAATLMPVVNAAGVYNLLVTNTQNGCTASDFATVTANQTAPTVGATNDGPLTCANPSTTISATSSASNSLFAWTGPGGFVSDNASDIVGEEGLYVVVITDLANGCTASASTLVTQNETLPTATATVSGPLDCLNLSRQIDGTGSSQGPDFNYQWTTADGNIVSGATTLTPVVNAAGTYNLLVINSLNGCTATATVAVSQTPAVGATIVSTQNVSCNSANGGSPNGSATVAVSGGTGNSSILWSNGETTATIQNLAAGSYSATVTDANSCTATATATISEPPVLNANATATPVSGAGQNDGTASANPSGGIPNAFGSYQFLWSNGGTTATISGLAPGNYSISITDLNGCLALQTVTVNAFNCTISATVLSENVVCNGQSNGSATVNLTGGVAPFSIIWSNGETTASIDSLAPGNYSVEILDANGCPASGSVTISQPAILLANATTTPLTSNGSNDGTASASPTGGNPGYQFLWSNGGTAATISGLAPGNFTVSITDLNGCTTTQTATVNGFNCALSASISSQNIACFGAANGSATAIVNGAAQPVNYLWSNGETTNSIDSLPPGVFSVAILDANGCPASLSATISQAAELVVNTSSTPPTMAGGNDGTATVSPSGGTPNYQVLWENGATTATISGLAAGTYKVSVTDANGCLEVRSVVVLPVKCAVSMQFLAIVDVSCFGLADGLATAEMIGGQAPFTWKWSNDAETKTISGLAPGNYSVTILDAQGCPAVGTAFIYEPAALVGSLQNVQNVVCPEAADGSATVSAAGGTAPFSFAWSNGQILPTATELPVGPFSVVVSDENGCSTTLSGSIISTDNLPPTLVCPANLTACAGAAFSFDAPVGSDNCSLNGATAAQTGGLPSGSIFPVGTTINTFLLTDASENTAVCSFSIAVAAPPAMQINAVGNDFEGLGTGLILTTVTGGQPPYSFSWTKNGQPFPGSTEDLLNLFAGDYQLEITDATGCIRLFDVITVQLVTATDEPILGRPILVLPNPVRDFFELKINGPAPLGGQLFDSNGRLIRTFSAAELLGEMTVGELSAGIYSLQMELENGRFEVLRFVKTD